MKTMKELSACATVILLASCADVDDRQLDGDSASTAADEASLPGEFIPAEDELPGLPDTTVPEPQPLPERPTVDVAEIGLLALLNDRELTDLERLDVDCAIRSDSAAAIIAHRDGADGVQGTQDDNLFETYEEVEDLPRVGPWTMGRLGDCAENLAYYPTPAEAAMLTLLNDRASTGADTLDERCAIRRDSALNIIAHRNGADGTADTPDDDLFHSMAEVEAIAMVGDWTVDRLIRCAPRLGYRAPVDTDDAYYTLADLIRVAEAQ